MVDIVHMKVRPHGAVKRPPYDGRLSNRVDAARKAGRMLDLKQEMPSPRLLDQHDRLEVWMAATRIWNSALSKAGEHGELEEQGPDQALEYRVESSGQG